MHSRTANDWIRLLRLQPHPEGGHYREVYRSGDDVRLANGPDRYGGVRQAATSIYYLLPGDSFSAFHRIRSDELWHFYAGDPLWMYGITPAGERIDRLLGSDPDEGQRFLEVAPAGEWFGARCAAESGYSLVGCTVAPGFSFDDFELGRRHELLERFPAHDALIRSLTRER